MDGPYWWLHVFCWKWKFQADYVLLWTTNRTSSSSIERPHLLEQWSGCSIRWQWFSKSDRVRSLPRQLSNESCFPEWSCMSRWVNFLLQSLIGKPRWNLWKWSPMGWSNSTYSRLFNSHWNQDFNNIRNFSCNLWTLLQDNNSCIFIWRISRLCALCTH